MGTALLSRCQGRAQALAKRPSFGCRLLANHHEESMHHSSQILAAHYLGGTSDLLDTPDGHALGHSRGPRPMATRNHPWVAETGFAATAAMEQVAEDS